MCAEICAQKVSWNEKAHDGQLYFFHSGHTVRRLNFKGETSANGMKRVVQTGGDEGYRQESHLSTDVVDLVLTSKNAQMVLLFPRQRNTSAPIYIAFN